VHHGARSAQTAGGGNAAPRRELFERHVAAEPVAGGVDAPCARRQREVDGQGQIPHEHRGIGRALQDHAQRERRPVTPEQYLEDRIHRADLHRQATCVPLMIGRPAEVRAKRDVGERLHIDAVDAAGGGAHFTAVHAEREGERRQLDAKRLLAGQHDRAGHAAVVVDLDLVEVFRMSNNHRGRRASRICARATHIL